MSRTSSTSNRLWVQEFFEDHPLLKQRSQEAFAGTGVTRDKAKVFCKLCLEEQIKNQKLSDEKEVQDGTRQEVRLREMIILDGKQ